MDDKSCGGEAVGMEAEIQELEQKIEVAKRKTQAHYQEWLVDLCNTQEALQAELAILREEETARAPPPSTPLQDTPRPQEPFTSTGHDMPRVLRSLSLQEIQ